MCVLNFKTLDQYFHSEFNDHSYGHANYQIKQTCTFCYEVHSSVTTLLLIIKIKVFFKVMNELMDIFHELQTFHNEKVTVILRLHKTECSIRVLMIVLLEYIISLMLIGTCTCTVRSFSSIKSNL